MKSSWPDLDISRSSSAIIRFLGSSHSRQVNLRCCPVLLELFGELPQLVEMRCQGNVFGSLGTRWVIGECMCLHTRVCAGAERCGSGLVGMTWGWFVGAVMGQVMLMMSFWNVQVLAHSAATVPCLFVVRARVRIPDFRRPVLLGVHDGRSEVQKGTSRCWA